MAPEAHSGLQIAYRELEIFSKSFISEAFSFHDSAFMLGRSFKNIKTSCLRLTYLLAMSFPLIYEKFISCSSNRNSIELYEPHDDV